MDFKRTDPISHTNIEDDSLRTTSAERLSRILSYSNSKGMLDTMNYKDNDCWHGLVSSKSCNRAEKKDIKDFVNAR